jgi:hypothetical protein
MPAQGGYSLSIPLTGGAAAPSQASSGADAGGDTGAVMFSDGAFQFGADDEGGSESLSAPTTQTQSQTTTPTQATTASTPASTYATQGYGNALPGGLAVGAPVSALQSYLPYILIVGGVLCFVLLRK